MKHLLLTILTLGTVSFAGAVDTDGLWERANAAYYDNDFAEAIALYDSIEESGMVSARLYYNQGNAYFKAGKIGKSILYYNKAQRLAPGDNDIAYNLAIANTYTRNRIEPVPEFFLKRWLRSVSQIMGGNAWALLSLGLFAGLLAGMLLYLLPLRRGVRKSGFYGAAVSLLFFVFALIFASADYRESIRSTHGIVTGSSASVKSSPDNAGKDLFLIYEGAKVGVRDELNGWCEIVLADGNRGWIKSSSIEMID